MKEPLLRGRKDFLELKDVLRLLVKEEAWLRMKDSALAIKQQLRTKHLFGQLEEHVSCCF